jgi:hypothetical protein
LAPDACLGYVEQKLTNERVGADEGDGIDADARGSRDGIDPTSP